MPARNQTASRNPASVLDRLEPSLAAWMRHRFGGPTPAQEQALPFVLAGESVLISSPTGTGKTLAGFLGVFDHIARLRQASGGLPPGIIAVYVSPLRALAYDLTRNLKGPLAEMGWDDVDVGTRTGDTTRTDRAVQRRRPPAILVTTPESLSLLLAQKPWAAAFAKTRFLIVDELHALAENKRGTLLMLAAERLEALRGSESAALVRIGLSATVSPLPLLAEFLAGGRPCRIVHVEGMKRAEIGLLTPMSDHPYPTSGYTAARMIPDLAEEVRRSRTVLVFTNTRGGAESIGLRLKQALPDLAESIEVHHASLDRELRIAVEDRLKRGELRAVVCSTSLELGIDIGSVDLVVMVSAPKGVSRALQRLGRSGHSVDAVSRGLLLATNINDLAECAATVRLMRERVLDAIRIPENPLDVLAQHLVGLAVQGCWTPDAAYGLTRRCHAYRNLARADFDRVLHYLQGGGSTLAERYAETFGKVVISDGVLATPGRRAERDFYQNVGTIVTEPMISVRLGARHIGTIEESFLKRMKPGDLFVLGGRVLRLLETRLLTAKVAEARGSTPTVPRWNANKMPLQSGVATEVARLRTEVAARLASGDPAAAEAWLRETYELSAQNARALRRHFALQASVSEIPVADNLLVETCAEGALRHVFVHSLIGRSGNDALSRILAKRIGDRLGGNALVTIDDYGILLTLQPDSVPPADLWPELLRPEQAEADLDAALADSQLVKWHFRGVSQTALMVPRTRGGAERGASQLQWSSEVIFEVLRRHEPDHPLLAEARAEAKFRFLDTERAVSFLESAGRLRLVCRNPDRISPFAFGIFVSRIKETMMLEDPEDAIERLFNEMYGKEPAAHA